MAEIAHGTRNAYVYHRCRCLACKWANTDYHRNRWRERVVLMAAGEADQPHGEYATYANWGCRCDPCKEANRVRRQAYRGAGRG